VGFGWVELHEIGTDAFVIDVRFYDPRRAIKQTTAERVVQPDVDPDVTAKVLREGAVVEQKLFCSRRAELSRRWKRN